jgi:uncharacterized protein YdeI (YjbR/CyaY-like superfamily)
MKTLPTTDPRIDAYIADAAEFARPILERARAIVHEACPHAEETIKWGMPTFVYAGGILCGMAAFKQHATFGFWKHALVMGEGAERNGMGSFGKMTSVRDLPPKKELVALIRKAMALNEEGVKTQVRKHSTPKPPPAMPADLVAALRGNAVASETFERFPPSHRREYIEWLEEAKREDTRKKRLAQTVEWLAEGKPRNWKYMKS